MKIVVLDGYTLNPGDNPWDPISELGEFTLYDTTPPEKTVERAGEADILITNKVLISEQMLAQLPRLKFVALPSTGFNVVDIAAARRRGISVSNVPEYGTDSVAQFTVGLLLELAHRIGHHSDAVHAGKWSSDGHFSFWDTPQVELRDKTLVIVGYGRIGKRVGEIAAALGMKVVPVGRDRSQLSAALAQADVVSLHCPLTEDTRGLVGKDFLSRMKKTAFLLNASRGPLIVEQDLADALNSGRIAGAAVDVVSVEPITPDNPLLKAKNCVITPHIAWVSLEARRRLMLSVADNIRAFLAGSPINVVNL